MQFGGKGRLARRNDGRAMVELQPTLGAARGQSSADTAAFVKNYRMEASTCQNPRAGQSGHARPDNRNAGHGH
jgi:hypothetical protein